MSNNAAYDIKADLEHQCRCIAFQIRAGFPEYDREGVEDDYGRVLDFLETVLDFQWVVASDRQTMLGCHLLVAWGGPNIWIDTQAGVVSGYWGRDRAESYYSPDGDGGRMLDEALQNIWEC